MSSIIRGNSRTTREGYPTCNGIVRRMVSLPRSILTGFSRAMGHITTQILPPPPPPRQQQPFMLPPPQNYQFFPPNYELENMTLNDEWAFLNNFEQKYGTNHPFFYACRFIQALKIAEDEKKFVFLYLHPPDNDINNNLFAAEFCRGTLCSEVVVQFIDANFVSWGGIVDKGDGLQMSGILRPDCLPFCAVVAPAPQDNIAVLQQIEGPVSPAELLEILQKTLEEQGVAFGSARAREEEKRRADRRLREEQDAAYFAALKLDQERQMVKDSPPKQPGQKPVAPIPATSTSTSTSSNTGFSQLSRNNPGLIKPSQVKEATTKRDTHHKNTVTKAKDNNQITQILVRFPNGERREHSFFPTDKVQAIYKYIDSLGLPGIGNYKLISSFPRKVFGADQMNMTLKHAGLHPRATLFIELP